MKYYKRKTHINGVFRQDMEDKVWKNIPGIISEIVHYLDPIKWMNLHDVLISVFDYARCFPTENVADIYGREDLCEAILDTLVLFDMVEVKNVN